MSLKVIGAGLGRTGTLSLKTALEELGFRKCYHMTEVLANPDHVAVWDAAGRGEEVDWDRLFEGYQATVDWPSCNFYQDLMNRYPDSKVILTVRDPERWYQSCRQTIHQVRSAMPGWVRLLIPKLRRFHVMADNLIWDGMFHGRFEDKAFAIDVFNRFNESVKRTVPPDRFLVYDIHQGWGPLCAFLSVPVPAGKPFPHVNDADEFRARIEKMTKGFKALGWGIVAFVTLVLLLLVSRVIGLW